MKPKAVKLNRETLEISFKKRSKTDHAADANAVGSQLMAVAALTKSMLSGIEKNKKFLTNVRPLRGGSLIVRIEIIIFDDGNLFDELPAFAALRSLLESFFRLRIEFSTEQFEAFPKDAGIDDDSLSKVDPLVFELLQPTHPVTRLFTTAFAEASADPTITAVELRSRNTTSPIAAVQRSQFQLFQQPLAAERLLSPKTATTQETLVIRSVAFDASLSWHFVWQGRQISASIRDASFLAMVNASREVFRRGDTLVVALERTQEFDATIGFHVDRRFVVSQVIEHIQFIEPESMFPASE